MRVKIESGWKAGEVEEMYSNDGTEISASSAVAVYESGNTRSMLIGTVITDAFYCAP